MIYQGVWPGQHKSSDFAYPLSIEWLRAGFQCGACSRYVVDEKNGPANHRAGERAGHKGEGPGDVLAALPRAQTDLRARGAPANHPVLQTWYLQVSRAYSGEESCLVIPALPLALCMKRQRHKRVRAHMIKGKRPRQQQSQRLGQALLSLVFEGMDRTAQRPLVEIDAAQLMESKRVVLAGDAGILRLSQESAAARAKWLFKWLHRTQAVRA